NDVVSRVGMGPGEKSDHGFINALARGRLNHSAKNRAPGGEFALETQQGSGNRGRFRARQPDYADAAATRRRGDGDDGVVEVHAGAAQRPWLLRSSLAQCSSSRS